MTLLLSLCAWCCLLLLPLVDCFHLIFLDTVTPWMATFCCNAKATITWHKVMSSSCITVLLTCYCHWLLIAFHLLLSHNDMHCVASAVLQCCYLRIVSVCSWFAARFAVAAVNIWAIHKSEIFWPSNAAWHKLLSLLHHLHHATLLSSYEVCPIFINEKMMEIAV